MKTLVEFEIFNNLNERSKQIEQDVSYIVKYQSDKWDNSNFKAKAVNTSEVA